MDVDPRTNVVVFQLNQAADALVTGQAHTLADDGVRQAWEGARDQHDTRPGDVVALHARWEPSPTDATFIKATFPNAAVTFDFPRPTPTDWEEALKAAEETLLATAGQEADFVDVPRLPKDGRNDGEAEHVGAVGETADRIERGDVDAQGELRPVLWSQSSPRVGALEEVPHWPLAGGRLHLGLAVVALTPQQTVGPIHVTYQQLGEHSFDALLAEACENLAARLRVHQTDDDLLSLSGTLIAAAVCLPEFFRRLSALIKADRLVVGLPHADEIYVAAADSGSAAEIHRMVRDSAHPATELVPSVLAIEGDHIEIVLERDPA